MSLCTYCQKAPNHTVKYRVIQTVTALTPVSAGRYWLQLLQARKESLFTLHIKRAAVGAAHVGEVPKDSAWSPCLEGAGFLLFKFNFFASWFSNS